MQQIRPGEHKANMCKEKDSCALYRDRGESEESVVHTANSERCLVFKAEIERAEMRQT